MKDKCRLRRITDGARNILIITLPPAFSYSDLFCRMTTESDCAVTGIWSRLSNPGNWREQPFSAPNTMLVRGGENPYIRVPLVWARIPELAIHVQRKPSPLLSETKLPSFHRISGPIWIHLNSSGFNRIPLSTRRPSFQFFLLLTLR
jgi:hypothetical protein